MLPFHDAEQHLRDVVKKDVLRQHLNVSVTPYIATYVPGSHLVMKSSSKYDMMVTGREQVSIELLACGPTETRITIDYSNRYIGCMGCLPLLSLNPGWIRERKIIRSIIEHRNDE